MLYPVEKRSSRRVRTFADERTLRRVSENGTFWLLLSIFRSFGSFQGGYNRLLVWLLEVWSFEG